MNDDAVSTIDQQDGTSILTLSFEDSSFEKTMQGVSRLGGAVSSRVYRPSTLCVDHDSLRRRKGAKAVQIDPT